MSNPDRTATADDIRRVFADADTVVVNEIIELQPTVADLEKAAQWIAGDRDLDQPEGQVLKGTAGEIVTLLAEEDEEDTPQR